MAFIVIEPQLNAPVAAEFAQQTSSARKYGENGSATIAVCKSAN